MALIGTIVVVLVVTEIMLVFGDRPDVAPFSQTHSALHRSRTHEQFTASRLLLPAFVFSAIAAVGLAFVRHRFVVVALLVIALHTRTTRSRSDAG